MRSLYSAAGVHPEVLQAIISGFLCAEGKLSVTHFALACTLFQVFSGKLFLVSFDQVDFAVILKLQKTHKEQVANKV